MNFGEKESFYERHRYFFQGYSFKFEGIKPLLCTKFENVVTELSGTVSTEAPYTLCDEFYIDRLENQKRTDLFSINFILDSIVAKKLLDIEKYRFTPTKLQQFESPCCLISKYVLRTNSCLRYYQDNVRCESCCIDNNNDGDNDKNSKSCEISKDEHETVIVNQEKLPKLDNKEIMPVDEENKTIQRKRKAIIAETFSPKKNKPSSSSSSVQIDTKNYEDEKDDARKKRRKRIVFIKEWEMLSLDDDIDPVEQENIASNSDTSGTGTEKSFRHNHLGRKENSDTSSIIEKKKWWTCLPPPNQSKTVMETLYEKGERRRRGHDFNMNEKRQMIAYLILRDKINECRSRDIWRQMHAEGYLNNRSVESLSNHFRKVILPHIDKFGLPEDILLKF